MLKQIWYYGAIPVREVAYLAAVTFVGAFVLGIAFGKLGIFYGWIVPLSQ